jgi:hypothetical protein
MVGWKALPPASHCPLSSPLLSPLRGGGRLTSVGFCHRDVSAWAEGRQGEVGRGSSGGEPLHTTPLSLAGKTYTCKGPGGEMSPEGQVARMPVDIRVHFLKFIKGPTL